MELEEVQKTAKLNRGLENTTNENRLNDLAFFKVEKRSLRGDMITTVKYVEGCYNKKVMNYPLYLMD